MEGPVENSRAKDAQLKLQAARKDELISFMELGGVKPLSVALALTTNEAARLARVGQEESARPLHDAARSLLAGLKNCMNFKDGLNRVSKSGEAIEAIVLAFAPDGSMASTQALQLLSVIAAFSEEALVFVLATQCGSGAEGMGQEQGPPAHTKQPWPLAARSRPRSRGTAPSAWSPAHTSRLYSPSASARRRGPSRLRWSPS